MRNGSDPSEEGEVAHGSLKIEKAVYGLQPEVCDTAVDVTAKLNSAIDHGRLCVPADNALSGNDPAPNLVKKLWVEFSVKPPGEKETARVRKSIVLNEGETLELPADAGNAFALPVFELARTAGGSLIACVTQPGVYEVKTRLGKTLKATVDKVPGPQPLEGPWVLRFPPKWGAPEQVDLEKLISWTDHPEEGIRHFSGTASYAKEFEWKNTKKDTRYYLDLGSVKEIAQVFLNGKDLGVLWKPPFRVDITDVLKPGRNRLEVRVTNLWPNRLIGDAQPAQTPGVKPITWTAAPTYRPDAPLRPAGLIGPVQLLGAANPAIKAR